MYLCYPAIQRVAPGEGAVCELSHVCPAGGNRQLRLVKRPELTHAAADPTSLAHALLQVPKGADPTAGWPRSHARSQCFAAAVSSMLPVDLSFRQVHPSSQTEAAVSCSHRVSWQGNKGFDFSMCILGE